MTACPALTCAAPRAARALDALLASLIALSLFMSRIDRGGMHPAESLPIPTWLPGSAAPVLRSSNPPAPWSRSLSACVRGIEDAEGGTFLSRTLCGCCRPSRCTALSPEGSRKVLSRELEVSCASSPPLLPRVSWPECLCVGRCCPCPCPCPPALPVEPTPPTPPPPAAPLPAESLESCCGNQLEPFRVDARATGLRLKRVAAAALALGVPTALGVERAADRASFPGLPFMSSSSSVYGTSPCTTCSSAIHIRSLLCSRAVVACACMCIGDMICTPLPLNRASGTSAWH
jgi:hypothetical protein